MNTIEEFGSGRPLLLLHGGGGPGTVANLAVHLAETMHVIAPTHPGWNGTARPERIDSVRALAAEYLRYLEDVDLRDVTVVGSSIGGWLAAELALADTTGRISGIVLINATGIEVPGQPITDISGLAPQDLAKISFHDASKFAAGAPARTPESIAIMRSNQAALATLANDPYTSEPPLSSRLAEILVPALVIWGESDGVVSLEYGRAYAAGIPGARFEIVPEAGHLPHIEQPAAVFALLDAFDLRQREGASSAR